jgi:hypothetical protein
VANINYLGFEFWIHPTGFLVHRQHEASTVGTMYKAQKLVYDRTAKWKRKRDTSLAGTTLRWVIQHLQLRHAMSRVLGLVLEWST